MVGSRQGTDESLNGSSTTDSAWRDMGRRGVTGIYNVPRDIFEPRHCTFLQDQDDGGDQKGKGKGIERKDQDQDEEEEEEVNGDKIRKPIQSADIVRAGTTYKDCEYLNTSRDETYDRRNHFHDEEDGSMTPNLVLTHLPPLCSSLSLPLP